MLEGAEERLARRDLEAARRCFDAAQAAGEDPDRCAGGRWTAAMLAGDFAAAWRESDALRARNAPDPHRFWDGSTLDGKRVMVRSLHGLGDAVQMLRFAPLLARKCRSVIWQVPPSMVEFAACFDDVGHVITWQDGHAEPAWDTQLEIMELPYLLRVTAESLPRSVPYCHLPTEIVATAKQKMQMCGTPTVGLVWSSGEWDPSRSIPLEDLTPLLDVSGLQFWNLQAEPASCAGILDAIDVTGKGLPALAATIANLDLVITVDTLAAHLAGALGRPVWLLLQYAADWRWCAAGDRSAWYPTMRILRQPSPGDWQTVISRVRQALEVMTQGKEPFEALG